MNAQGTMRNFLLASTCLVLAACQSTAFEKPPVAETACDTRLAGHWESVDEKPEDNGDVQLDIGRDCQLQLSERKDGKLIAGETTMLHNGKLGDGAFLWVDSGWSLRRFNSDLSAQAGDIFLMRYHVDGDALVLNAPDDKAIAHRIIDDKIPGTTHKDDDALQNRIIGGPHPEVLELDGFFSSEALRFRRLQAPAGR
jgi:hypothetical protein